MTRQERLIRANSIMRRQAIGTISKEEASAEFDALLDASTGDLHYFSDTTGMRANWNPSVMLMPHRDDPTKPSNTGILTQGSNRGKIATKPGETPNPRQETLAHFLGTSGVVQ